MTKKSNRKNSEQGFTLLETMFSAVILTIGLLAVLAVFAVAVASTQNVQLDMIAQQKAKETLESIFTARQTSQITFAQIQNVPNGIFTAGMVTMTDAGPDGLDGTADDVTPQPISVPGPSGVLTGSSPPDVKIALTNFQRQIVIANVPNEPNLRQVTVTVQYPGSQGKFRSYSVTALISSFR